MANATSLGVVRQPQKRMETPQTPQPLLIEINGQPHEVITGNVKLWRRQPIPADDYGYINGTSLTRDIRFAGDAFCTITAGLSHPKFNGSINRDKFTIHPNTKVVLLRPHNPKDRPYTLMVGVKRYYDMALAEIATRPTYRVRHVRGRNAGKPIKDSTFAEGTAVVLQHNHPRLAANDPLAPIYKKGNLTVRSLWQRKDDNSWVNCDDPRPFPEGTTQRIIRVTKLEELAGNEFGTAGKGAQVSCTHIGVLIERHKDEFLGDRFIFEESSDGINWIETGDPRNKFSLPAIAAVSAEPVRREPDAPVITRSHDGFKGFTIGELTEKTVEK